jgi:isopentenyl-diphosphate delta-isomerase
VDDRRELVILVDEAGRPIGTAPKIPAHLEGLRHRALSVIICDPKGRLLLQKRHADKYHSGGLWTNACCSHPRPGEATADAASRRLQEEMGISCPLSMLFEVPYRSALGNGMIEHEWVHVLAGCYTGRLTVDPREADGYAWIEPPALLADVQLRPLSYSVWFHKYVTEYWASIAEFVAQPKARLEHIDAV